MEMKEFEKYKKVVDERYPHINKYELETGEMFFVEPNFYTQLEYAKDHFLDKYEDILEHIENAVKRNKKVIFTADFDNPVVYLDDYIYRELSDIMGELKIGFDNKSNPDSDWKDSTRAPRGALFISKLVLNVSLIGT